MRQEFQNLRKGDLSTNEYCKKIHQISKALASIGRSLFDSDMVMKLLSGLPIAYENFILHITSQTPQPSFYIVWNEQQQHEGLISHIHGSSHLLLDFMVL